MIYGIIQRVFNKHKEIREKEFVPTTHFGLDTLFENLEEELIKSINERFNKFKHYNPSLHINYDMESLYRDIIGDNQE